MTLRSRLGSVSPERLIAAVGGKGIKRIQQIRGEQGDLTAIGDRRVDYALAILGSEALESQLLRQLLFEQMPLLELRELADKYGKRSYELPHDNALVLSQVPWRAGSEFVFDVAARLGIEADYLPENVSLAPRIEVVEPFSPTLPLHEYQQQVVARGLKLLEQGQKRFVMQLPTGAGKTRTCLELVVSHAERDAIWETGGTVVWLAHMEELCEQAIDGFRRIWSQRGDRAVKVVRGWRGKASLEDIAGSFFACTLQTLSAAPEGGQLRTALLQQCRLIVVDEAHRASATTFAGAIRSIYRETSVLIGLTATPGRGKDRDRDNEALAKMFGGSLLEPKWPTNPIQYLRSLGVLARTRRRVVETGIEVAVEGTTDGESGHDGVSRTTLETLSRNSVRNRLICDLIREEVLAGRPTIVFCCSVAHARLLAAVLALDGVACGSVDSEMRGATRRRTIQAYRRGELNALLNFGVLSTGFDAPRTRTVMITRPTTSLVLYSQMVGRGLRGPLMGGGASCDLIDVRDNLRGFGSMEEIYSYFDSYWE